MSLTTPMYASASSPHQGLSPQERLAITRKAIVRHMHKGEQQGQDDAGEMFGEPSRGIPESNWGLVKQAVRSWWHRHPASIAVEIAEPFLGQYARTHPAKLLAIAAGVGAAAVLFRPWRLLSLSKVSLAVVRSPDIAGAISTMIMRYRPGRPN
jgi:hypothetical protein